MKCRFSRLGGGSVHGVRARCVATALLWLGLCSGLLQAATLEVTASETTVPPGGSVEIAVSISGLGDMAPPSLGTFDLSLVFDPAVFALDPMSTVVGDLLGDEGAAEVLVTVTPGPGDLEVVALSLLTPAELIALQPGSFELFRASFTPISIGEGVFDVVANGPLGDENGVEIPLDGTVPVTVTGGGIIDIPTIGQWGRWTLVLLLGCAGLLAVRRTF